MAKITIEKPGYGTKKKTGGFAFVLILILLCVAFGLGYYHYAVPVTAVQNLEIKEVAGEVQHYSRESGEWSAAKSGDILAMGDRLATGEASEVNFGADDQIKVRLKGLSEFTYKGAAFLEKQPLMRFALDDGVMFIATQKGLGKEFFEIVTPHFRTKAKSGYFRIEVDREQGNTSVGLLRGNAEVFKNELFAKEGVTLKGLESIKAEQGKASNAPARVTRDEWKQMNEVYDLILKSEADEGVQMDLAKEAGDFFGFVFDHGTFYTPKFGYCGREFFRDPDSGEVLMEMEYDVFPRGSFSGAYIKVRDMDLEKFEAIQFDIRRVEDEGFPQNVRIELKNKSGTVRAFAAKSPNRQWETLTFPLHVRKETDLNEVTFVFMHDRVGEFKRGALQLRRVTAIPKPEQERVEDVGAGGILVADEDDAEVKRYKLPSPSDYLFDEIKKIETIKNKVADEIIAAPVKSSSTSKLRVKLAEMEAGTRTVAEVQKPTVKVIEVDNIVSTAVEPIVPPAQKTVKRPKISLKDLPLLEDLPTS